MGQRASVPSRCAGSSACGTRSPEGDGRPYERISPSSRDTETPNPDRSDHPLNLDTTESRSLAEAAAKAAADKLATDIHILDMGELLGITDFFVICSARNDRQLRTVVDEVQLQLKQQHGAAARRREGQPDTGWMLLDYGPIIVHAFTEEQRSFYDLERLWSDAPTTVYDDTPDAVSVSAATGDGDA